MAFVGHGIYYIEHAHVPVRMSLPQGAIAGVEDGTHVVAWSVTNEILDHLWFVVPVPNEPDTYTIRNILRGSYMDMYQSLAANSTPVIGSQGTGNDNQKWIIKKETSGTGFWKIQNKKTQTFVDLLNGGTSNGTQIVGWQGSWNDGTSLGHQHWKFNCQSMTGGEIHAALQRDPSLHQDFRSYLSDGLYLILSRQRLVEVWDRSGLANRKWRSEIFDCDDFAFVYKAEFGKWGDEQFKADGFAVLCGVMFGSRPDGAHAYNWMINPDDHSRILFCEPQSRNNFSDTPWGYQAYFGVF